MSTRPGGREVFGPAPGMEEARQFAFTDRDFRFISELVGRRTGIVLCPSKRDMVYSRLARRLRQLGLRRFQDYCRLLKTGDEQELVEFTNALTTNLTAFFREPHHFDYLQRVLLPELLAAKHERRLRLWSAGCSTGEEAYSLAMVVGEAVPAGWDVRILATDLDSAALATAKAGVYPQERVAGLGRERLHTWFQKGRGTAAGKVRVNAALRALVTFKSLNLVRDWPMRGLFDVIFCRNVVIYFSKESQRRLFERFAERLTAAGHLFVGHSESLYRVSDRFESLGQTIYRRRS